MKSRNTSNSHKYRNAPRMIIAGDKTGRFLIEEEVQAFFAAVNKARNRVLNPRLENAIRTKFQFVERHGSVYRDLHFGSAL